jgi:DNA-binding beta-propeller fold protein YncE
LSKKLVVILWLVCLFPFVVNAQGEMTHYDVSWLANSYSGADERWVQTFVDAMFVAPDGTVFTNSGWDEGGHEAVAYRDGEFIGRIGNLHGVDRNGGYAITADEHYIYATMQQHGCYVGDDSLNENGLQSFPDCEDGVGALWFGIVRFHRDTREPAPFATGNGVDGALLIVDIVPTGEDTFPLTGITTHDDELFVSSLYSNTIKVYAKSTMTLIREFPFQSPDELIVDRDGSLWIIENGPTWLPTRGAPPRILHYTREGELLPQTITFSDGGNPTALAIDGEGRLLVADNGPDQNIKIYDDLNADPTLVDTFGATGGIFSGTPGEVAPLKFHDLKGVGVDAEGNIYVGMGSGISGTELQSYGSDGTLNWQLFGLVFVDNADFDPDSDATILYTKHERFVMNYDKPTANAWQYAGYTLNRFRYPQDPRLWADSTSIFFRRVDGRSLMFVTGMSAGELHVYRFNAETDGEVAIPTAMIVSEPIEPLEFGIQPLPNQPTDSAWLWVDADGDGAFDDSEYETYINPNAEEPSWGWWVGSDGTIWRSYADGGIRRIPLEGFNAHGSPIYRMESSILEPNPAPFNSTSEDFRSQVNRMIYDTETDTLYLSGYTPEYPNEFNHWKDVGRLIVRYDAWSTGNREPSWFLPLDQTQDRPAVSMAIAGDYIFVGYNHPEPPHIEVYSRTDGDYIGRLSPNEVVGGISGWFDVAYAINATRRLNGQYVIVAEEDLRAKLILYRW